jgi:hypothetical protein
MFAMQINVDRMPHGLFFKFSTDIRLMLAFTATFLLAIAIAASSLLIIDARNAEVILAAFWGTFLIVILVVYAYRRALFLINPIKQLTIVLDEAVSSLRMWERRANRARPLFLVKDNEPDDSGLNNKQDLPLVAFFQANPYWDRDARRAIDDAISLSRKYSEHGDYVVSSAALNVMLEINATYVEAKGKTFFGSVMFLNIPLTTDVFVNHTLEHLRQTAAIALTRGDEQFLQQTIEAMTRLCGVYMVIDYGPGMSRTHPQLAAGYLSEAVQAAARHGLTDVVMQGVRWMGQAGLLFLQKGDPTEAAALIDKIGLVGGASVVNEKSRPVTLTAVEQLATLTIALLRSDRRDIGYAVGQIRSAMSLVSEITLEIPTAPFENHHNTYLAPYYSGSSTGTLIERLGALANALIDMREPTEVSKAIVHNFEEWADGLYDSTKKLLLLAIEKKSHLTFDVIHWIESISEILISIANTSSCDAHAKKDLQKHALWLISTLSWIPHNKETVRFVENFGLTEMLFKTAIMAYRRECPEIGEKIRDLLADWTFKASAHQTGWAILERSLYGLAALALHTGELSDVSVLKAEIERRLGEPGAPGQEERDRTAHNMRERACALYRRGHWSSAIEGVMGQLDENELKPLLEDIANLLSPETSHDGEVYPFDQL